MSVDIYAAPVGVMRAMYLRSDYTSPDELRQDLPNFEKTAQTLRVSLIGPEEELWTLKFTDLEREIQPATGTFEEYCFNIATLFEGRLWEIRSNQPREILKRTVDRLVAFSTKLEHAFIPPKAIEKLMEEYGSLQELLGFSANRDYFTISVTQNPGIQLAPDYADLKYKSSNALRDYEVLVKKERPVGPLMLDSLDLKIRMHGEECSIRLASDGYLSQIGTGERQIYRDVRGKLLRYFEEHDRLVEYFPKSAPLELKDEEHKVTVRAKRLVQFPRPLRLELSRPIDGQQLMKLKGLFTSGFYKSRFIGFVEKEIPNESFLVRTTDIRGGGDALIEAGIGSSEVTVRPLPSTTLRTVERIYRAILQKFDVDASLMPARI